MKVLHQPVSKRVLVYVVLDGADADGSGMGIENASAFAEAFLRADAGTDFWHIAGGTGNSRRFGKVAFSSQREPFWNAVSERAPFTAGG